MGRSSQRRSTKSSRVQVTLGTKRQALFGNLSGRTFDVVIVGRVAECGAIVVRDMIAREHYLVHPRMVSIDTRHVESLACTSPASALFPFRLFQKVPFTFGAAGGSGLVVNDDHGNVLNGTKTNARVIHRIKDGAKCWYVVRVAKPHWDPTDPDNWYTGYDIRSTNQMY